MADSFPEFTEQNRIDNEREWIAAFDSYDARNEDCYYLVTVSKHGRPNARFMAEVGLIDLDDWTTPEFAEAIRAKVGAVAASGRSNCEYAGLPSTWSKAGGRI